MLIKTKTKPPEEKSRTKMFKEQFKLFVIENFKNSLSNDMKIILKTLEALDKNFELNLKAYGSLLPTKFFMKLDFAVENQNSDYDVFLSQDFAVTGDIKDNFYKTGKIPKEVVLQNVSISTADQIDIDDIDDEFLEGEELEIEFDMEEINLT